MFICPKNDEPIYNFFSIEILPTYIHKSLLTQIKNDAYNTCYSNKMLPRVCKEPVYLKESCGYSFV